VRPSRLNESVLKVSTGKAGQERKTELNSCVRARAPSRRENNRPRAHIAKITKQTCAPAPAPAHVCASPARTWRAEAQGRSGAEANDVDDVVANAAADAADAA